MKSSVCGADCAACPWNAACSGCSDEKCFIARYITQKGKAEYEALKQKMIREFNALDIPGMSKIDQLYALTGSYVNLEYPFPNGQRVKFLEDNSMYLGNQVECACKEGRCFGLLADEHVLLVSEYGENGTDPQLLYYKRRDA